MIRELNIRERKIIDLSAELWNHILELETIHKADNPEMCKAIHDIQARIMSRPVREGQKEK